MSLFRRVAVSPVRKSRSKVAASPVVSLRKAFIRTSRNMVSVTRPMMW